MAENTTIKVPKRLRERVMQAARAEGLTAAEFLELVTQEHARRRRFEAVRTAYLTTGVDADYRDLSADWGRADS